MKRFALITGMLWLTAASAAAQTCPKVVYSTPTATLKSLVAAVNCLAAGTTDVPKAAPIKTGGQSSMQVDSFQIVGPQHSRAYASVVLAVLSVPTGGITKTAVVTPDTREATVTAEAGGSCSVKINLDKTIDSRCYIAGGTVYVVYR